MSQDKLNKFYYNQNETEYRILMENLNIGRQSIKREDFFSNFNFKGLNVLEVGVGQGYNLEFYKGAKTVVGLDINTTMLDVCRREILSLGMKKKVTIVEWDARLSYTEFFGKFDIVILTYCLSGAPDSNKIFANSVTYLKAGGLLGILDSPEIFKGNVVEKSRNFIGKIINNIFENKMSSNGFSGVSSAWDVIFKNRKDIKFIKNEVKQYYKKKVSNANSLTLIFQKTK
jgi:ubiquinone/menaquinone biosynthesis C-methylase UbiE